MDAFNLLIGVPLSLLAAALPTAFWARIVWWSDRYEREPAGLLIASFVWGAVPAVILALVAEMLLGAWEGGPFPFGDVVAVSGIAPVVEELAKGLGLWLIVRLWRAEFDGVMDGILYGALIGFGFATTENLFYYVSALVDAGWGDWGLLVFVRGALFGLNHAFFTAFTGAGLGYALTARSGRGRRWALLGLTAAILAHVVHNLGTSLAERVPAAVLLSLGSDLGGVLLVIGMIILALRQEQRWLQEELAGEVGRLFTQAEYEALASLRNRAHMLIQAQREGGWAQVRIAQQFQERATEWALRRRRARLRADDAVLVRLAADAEARLLALKRP